jgi:hypothetical protein
MHILIDAAGRLNDIVQDEYVQILPEVKVVQNR